MVLILSGLDASPNNGFSVLSVIMAIFAMAVAGVHFSPNRNISSVAWVKRPSGIQSIVQKEKSHVMDYRSNPHRLVAARLFRSEHQPIFPEGWQLGSRPDCHCRHPHHLETPRDRIILATGAGSLV